MTTPSEEEQLKKAMEESMKIDNLQQARVAEDEALMM